MSVWILWCAFLIVVSSAVTYFVVWFGRLKYIEKRYIPQPFLVVWDLKHYDTIYFYPIIIIMHFVRGAILSLFISFALMSYLLHTIRNNHVDIRKSFANAWYTQAGCEYVRDICIRNLLFAFADIRIEIKAPRFCTATIHMLSSFPEANGLKPFCRPACIHIGNKKTQLNAAATTTTPTRKNKPIKAQRL